MDAIIEKLQDSVTIVVAHIGGQARRGELSDGFINAVLPVADYIIVVEEGDADGLFSNYAAENNVPISICPRHRQRRRGVCWPDQRLIHTINR